MRLDTLYIALWALALAVGVAATWALPSPVPGVGLAMLSFVPLLLARRQWLLRVAAVINSALLLAPIVTAGPRDVEEICSRLLAVGIVWAWVFAGWRYEQLHRRLRESDARLRTTVAATSSIVWTAPVMAAPAMPASAAPAEAVASSPGLAPAPVLPTTPGLPPTAAQPPQPAHAQAALVGQMNGEWRVFTGQRPAESAGDGWLRMIHEDDRERLRALWLFPDVNAWPERYDQDVRVWHAASSTWRHMQAHLRPMRAFDDAVVEWIGVFVDVHARKVAERSLALGDERLKEAQRLARLGQWEYDPATDRVTISAELSVAFGGDAITEAMELDEVLRMLVGTPPDHIDGLIERVLREGEGMQGEYAVLLPDGQRRVALILARRGVHGDGRDIVWGIAQDVTDQARWREREQVLESRLTQSVKMQTVGELSSGLAHDFNNVLATMLGYGELALHRVKDRDIELDGYLQRVLDAGRRARDLLRTLMMVGRGKVNTGAPDEVAEVELMPVVAETVNLVRVAMPPGIRLTESFAPDVRGHIDRVNLQEAVLNLCVNARDSIGELGEIGVAVRQQRVVGDCAVCGEHIQAHAAVVSVSDDGPGIAPDVLPRIFEPFFSTKRSGEGTGLGLAMVARLLHSHGAHVLVRSAPGATTFDLVLASGAQAPARAPAVVATLPRADAAQGQRYCVLVLDDEAPIGRLIGSAFEQSGVGAVVFVDPREATAAFVADPDRFDLIVTDLTMPVMSGIEFATTLRRLRPVPVLMLTGGGTSDEELYASGVLDQILRKPFSMKELLGTAAQLLQSRTAVPLRAQVH